MFWFSSVSFYKYNPHVKWFYQQLWLMRPAYTKYVYDLTIVTPSLLVSFYDTVILL